MEKRNSKAKNILRPSKCNKSINEKKKLNIEVE